MSKHTPGPWNAEGPDWAGDFNIAPSSETACVAAAVSNMRPAEEVSANARLISAAPDLLDALKRAAIDLTEKLEERGELADSVTIALMHAAIAKAEGLS